MMNTALWRPDTAGEVDELSLVACVASDRCLYVIVEGPSVIPRHKFEDPEALPMIHVHTDAGTAVGLIGISGGGTRRHGKNYIAQFELPDLADVLHIRLVVGDIEVFSVQALPVR